DRVPGHRPGRRGQGDPARRGPQVARQALHRGPHDRDRHADRHQRRVSVPGVVDAHQHVWDLAAHAQPWLELPGNEPLLRNYSEADLRPQAAAAGVTATVVVQTVTEATETPELL